MTRLLPLLCLAACTSETAAVVASAPVDAGQTWVEAVAPGDTVLLEAPARVLAAPGSEAVVTTPLRATVVRVRVRPGDVVVAGAPLVDVLMPEALDAAARFEGAKARLTAWTERLAQLQQLRTEGLARALDVSEAAARVAEVRAEQQAARATLLAAGVREADVSGLLGGAGTLSLRAPVGGVVTSVTATVGESRDSASGPLVQVSSAGAVRIEARFSRAPPEGAWLLVTPTGRSNVTLVGRAPTADPRDGTFVAWFEADGGTAPLAGTLGRVTLESQQVADVVRVPARAVHRLGGVPMVTTRDAAVSVDVLQCGGSDCLVRGALRPGQSVSLEAR